MKTSLAPVNPSHRTPSKTLRYVILGLGHMGLRGLLSLAILKEFLRADGINLEVTCVADIKPETRNAVKEIVDALSLSPKICINFEEIVGKYEDLLKPSEEVIVYDASPSHDHYENLVLASKYGFSYLGEKPILTEPNQLDALATITTNVWCDFIETESLVFQTLRNVFDQGFQVTGLRFWRYGSTGCKKIFEPTTRTGVTGGALFDKAPHDLSLSLGVLGRDNLAKWEVRKASIGSFMPANVYALFSELPLFTAKDGRATQEIQSGYDPEHFGVGTADAETSFQVNWILKDGRTIPAEYYFSWIGVPNDDGLRAEIGKHEIPDNWLGSKVVDLKQVGMSLAIGYRIEEARIGIIDGVLNGNETQIICNFLGKTDLGLARPWIRIVSGSACKELDLVSLPFGNNSLARVLQRISNCCAGNTSAPLLDKGSITIVHGIMKDVAKEAFKSPRTPQDEIRVTKDLFRSRLCLPS